MNSIFEKYLYMLKLIAFIFIFYLLGFNIGYTLANKETGYYNQKSQLPLEISEKYYKKEAISKFNDAVNHWELRSSNPKNIDQAISLWEQSLVHDSTLWVSYLGLGQAYDLKAEYKKSLNAYSKYLELAPQGANDIGAVKESVKYLTHLLRHGEESVKGNNYLSLVQTTQQDKKLYVRWDLSAPLNIYFYPASGVPNYREEFKDTFLYGAMLWQEVLPELKFNVINNSSLLNLDSKERNKKEKELIEQAQIKVIFPSRFKIKGDSTNPIAGEFDAQSFPIIRDKKNFRVLGVIMISPYIYHQAQIAIPLEPLSKLDKEKQLEKLKIIAARETGHVLGLWGFSPNPDDLMFEGEVKNLKLSGRDKNTIKKLYELPTDREDVLTNK